MLDELAKKWKSVFPVYTEQKWKRNTTIIYIFRESIGQKVFNKA